MVLVEGGWKVERWWRSQKREENGKGVKKGLYCEWRTTVVEVDVVMGVPVSPVEMSTAVDELVDGDDEVPQRHRRREPQVE